MKIDTLLRKNVSRIFKIKETGKDIYLPEVTGERKAAGLMLVNFLKAL
jgi:hypothetical protein